MSPIPLPALDEPFFDEVLETMPRDAIEDLQLERLLETVALAYERAPLVRETWDLAHVKPSDIRSLSDFRDKAPLLSKDAVRHFCDTRNDPFGGVLCVDPRELTAIMSTSGTTGDPTLTAERWGAGSVGPPALMFRDFWGMGVRPGDHCALFLFTFRGPTYGFLQGLGCTPILFDYDVSELERLLRLSIRYRPTAIYNFGGTMINAVADVADAVGIDPREAFGSYRAVVWAGEPLGARATALANSWGLPLFEHSNIADVTACFECPVHDGMHVWEDTALVEGIEEPGHAGDGRCELVATSLTNRVSPLVRYRSDDVVQIDRRPCPCGRTHARVWTVGRKSDEVVVQGRAVLPADVWSAIESVPACRLGLFQVVRPGREVDVLRLRVGYQDVPEHRLDGVRTEVAAAVATAVELVPEIELVPNEALLRLGPPHKIPRVSAR